jgi:hypothetical protein
MFSSAHRFLTNPFQFDRLSINLPFYFICILDAISVVKQPTIKQNTWRAIRAATLWWMFITTVWVYILCPHLMDQIQARRNTLCCRPNFEIWTSGKDEDKERVNSNSRIENGARGNIVGWGTMLQAGRSRVWFPMNTLDFSIELIFPAALWPWDWLSL